MVSAVFTVHLITAFQLLHVSASETVSDGEQTTSWQPNPNGRETLIADHRLRGNPYAVRLVSTASLTFLLSEDSLAAIPRPKQMDSLWYLCPGACRCHGYGCGSVHHCAMAETRDRVGREAPGG